MSKYKDEIRAIVAGMENQQSQDNTQPPPEDMQDIYVFVVRETEAEEDHTQIVDSTPVPAPTQRQNISYLPAYAICSLYIFLIFSTLVYQLYLLCNPPLATITIIPKSQIVTLSGTVQLGRLLQPITISQSQTTKATGKGHQDARVATGTVTFFNGLFTQQFIASGTAYTGQDGVAIVTTQDATIPPGNPGSGYGTLTVSAQAVTAGTSGNIQAGDITITINNGLLVRNNQFSNGQDERTYTTVTHNDIHSVSTVLKTSLALSMQGALQGQLRPQEQLQILPCTPTVTSDHPIGAEATSVKVTVSQTCSAVAYNSQELQTKASDFLTHQVATRLGTAYSLFRQVQVSVQQASVSSTTPHLVFLSFHASGTWIYGISHQSQEQMKHLITGKTTQQALQLLASLPGVESATIHFSGFGDDTKLPKQSSNIHLVIIVV